MNLNTSHLLDTKLVVGADGLIGHALLTSLTFTRQPVLGSTRRKPSKSHSQLLIDLAQPSSTWNLPSAISCAYLCAGIASIQACTQNPQQTAAINCDATIALAQALADRGAKVIYLSSNQVFDGQSPHRKANEPVAPITEYGRQKAATEKAILALGDHGVVVRLTKVLAHASPMLQNWRDTLRQGKPIHPFDDMRMAPVALDHVVKALTMIGRLNLEPGDRLLQISASADISYEQAALHIARRIGADESLVQPTSARAAGLPAAATPLHTTLDTAVLTRLTGLGSPSPYDTLDDILDLQQTSP